MKSILTLILLIADVSYAANSYNLAAAASQTITEHSVTKLVTNNCAKAIFIPTKTSTEWSRFYTTPPACVTAVTVDPCSATTPTPGITCADGMIYAGKSAGGIKYETTPGDCTDSATPICDNVGTDSVAKVWGASGTTTGATSTTDGVGNVAIILAAFPAMDTAAKWCDVLVLGGHTDWYLGAQNEHAVMHANLASIPGYHNSGGQYFTSTEVSTTNAKSSITSKGKNSTTGFVRCIRVYP